MACSPGSADGFLFRVQIFLSPFFQLNWPINRDAREQAAYEQLIASIPNMEATLLEASAEDIRTIADNVSSGHFSISDIMLMLSAVAKGHERCSIWRHEKFEDCGNRLDYTQRRAACSILEEEHEVRPWFPTCTHRGLALSCTFGLFQWRACCSYFVLLYTELHSRTRAKVKNGEIVVNGNDWPIFLYAGESFDQDDPWNGLFRGPLLVTVSFVYNPCCCFFSRWQYHRFRTIL